MFSKVPFDGKGSMYTELGSKEKNNISAPLPLTPYFSIHRA
jgi:hypothetical protein